MVVWGPDAEPRDHPEFAEPVPAPRPPERWWDLFLVPVVAIAMTAGLMVVLGFVLGLIALSRGVAPDNLQDILLIWAGKEYVGQALMIFLYVIVILMAIMLFYFRGRSISKAYFAPIGWQAEVLAVVVGVVTALAVLYLMSIMPADAQRQFEEQELRLIPSDPLAIVLLLILAIVMAPLAEEIYFRGIMLRVLKRHLPIAAAVVVSSCLFSLIHGHLFILTGVAAWVITGLLFLVGVLLAMAAGWAGSLRAAAILHMSYNAIMLGPVALTLLAGVQT